MGYFILYKLRIDAYFRINHANNILSLLCVFSVLDYKPVRVRGLSPLFLVSHRMLSTILVLTVD